MKNASLLVAAAVLAATVGATAAMAGDAIFWGNVKPGYVKLFASLGAKGAEGARPPIDDFARHRLAGIVYAGRSDAAFSDEDISRLRDYVSEGGILLLDSGTPAWMGKDTFDLSRAEALLGAKRYFYGGGIAPTTDLSKAILGDAAEKGNAYLDDRRDAGLSQLSGMRPIYGDDKTLRLGVNRVGKGAVAYTAIRAGVNPDYDAVLVKLVETLLDPEKLDAHFPILPGNALASFGDRTVHLAVQAKDAAAAKLLTETLTRQSGQTDFVPGRADDELTVHIGLTPYAESLNLDWETLHEFGYYMILRDGRNLVLAGKNPQANRYAVIDFMKRYSNYRQFGHSKFTEVMPRITRLQLPEKLEAREEPSIHSYVVAWASNPDFGRSNRNTVRATHSLYRLVPPEKYAKSNPEYFPEIGGKRVSVAENLHGAWNPCLANPDLPRLVREYAEEYFSKNPEKIGLPLGVNDGAGDCQCEYCSAEFAKYGNQYSGFYNMAARELAAIHPNKFVAMIAYGARAAEAPRDMVMEPNILAEITGITRSAFAEMPKWRAAGAKRFGLYDYLYTCGSFYVTPRYNPRLVADAWRRAYSDYGLSTIWVELYPATNVFESPRQYVLDELAWNIDVDIDALLRDYFTSMYGPAAAPMENFFNRLEEIHARRRESLFFFADRNKATQFDPFTFSDLDYLYGELAKASALAASDPVPAWRVGVLRRFFDLVRLHIFVAVSARELSSASATSGAEASHLADMAESAYAAVRAIDHFRMTEEEEEAIFTKNHSLAKFNQQTYLIPLRLLDPAVDRAFDRIAAYLDASDDRKASIDFWRQQSKRGDEYFRAAASSRIYLAENRPENLFANPGFEPVEAPDISESDLKKYEWNRVHPGLKGWSAWNFQNSVTRFYWDSEEKFSGDYSVAIGENQIAGCIQGVISIEPGCRYRLSVRVKRNRDLEGAMTLRFQADGKWHDQAGIIRAPYPPESVGEWAEASVAFTAPTPENATKLKLLTLLNAPVQPDGAMIWFDDIVLLKIGDPLKKNNQ